MKLAIQTVSVASKCKLCEKIDTKQRRRAAEVERILRWKREGIKFVASIESSAHVIKRLEREIHDLDQESQRQHRIIGVVLDGAPVVIPPDTPGTSSSQNLNIPSHDERSPTQRLSSQDGTQPYSSEPTPRVSHQMAELDRRRDIKDSAEKLQSQIAFDPGFISCDSGFLYTIDKSSKPIEPIETQSWSDTHVLDSPRRNSIAHMSDNMRIPQKIQISRSQQSQQPCEASQSFDTVSTEEIRAAKRLPERAERGSEAEYTRLPPLPTAGDDELSNAMTSGDELDGGSALSHIFRRTSLNDLDLNRDISPRNDASLSATSSSRQDLGTPEQSNGSIQTLEPGKLTNMKESTDPQKEQVIRVGRGSHRENIDFASASSVNESADNEDGSQDGLNVHFISDSEWRDRYATFYDLHVNKNMPLPDVTNSMSRPGVIPTVQQFLSQIYGIGTYEDSLAQAQQGVKAGSEVATMDEESISPEPSLTDGSTISSIPSRTILQEVAILLVQDSELKSVFKTIRTSTSIDEFHLRRELRAKVESLGKDLEIEAQTTISKVASGFLQKKSSPIARKVTSLIFIGSEQLPLDTTGSRLHRNEIICRYLEQMQPEIEGEIASGKTVNTCHGDDLDDPDDPDGEEHEVSNDVWQMMADFVTNSAAMNKFRARLRAYLRNNWIAFDFNAETSQNTAQGTACDTEGLLIEFKAMWAQKMGGKTMPADLKQLKIDHVEFLTNRALTRSDDLKLKLESYSGERWNWWPFAPPWRMIEEGKTRLEWQCSCQCEDVRHIDIPHTVAVKYQDILTREHAAGGTKSRSGSTTSNQTMVDSDTDSSANTITDPPFCKQHNSLQRLCDSRQASREATLSVSGPPIGSTESTFYILFCTFKGDDLRFSQIDIPPDLDDNHFLDALRDRYREILGRWRYHFHPRTLEFCSFAKYIRSASGSVTKQLAPELPEYDDDDYSYAPRAQKGEPYNPPIPAHEWYHHLYKRRYRAGCRCALNCIPKRRRRFTFYDHAAGREHMWGLFAEMRISAWRVLLWTLAITLGGWIFFVWWLANHSSDFQNAAVPVSLTLLCMTWLWLPLNEHFKQKF